MKKKIKIGITGANPFSGNRGVGALAISTIYLLNKIAKENDCTVEITTINYNYEKYLIDLGVEVIKIHVIWEVSIFGIKDIIRLITNPKKILSFLEYFKFDYLLCMGGGDSFSDIYGEDIFKIINSQHQMARLLRKKYLLLPQTIGPFKDIQIRKKATRSIEKAQLVLARDMQSFDYIKKNTKQNNIFEIIDVAFFMPYQKQKFSNNFIHVGLNISSLLWHGGFTRNNQFGLKCDYQMLVRNIIDYFFTFPNVIIHIVPHVVHTDSHIENDYEVSFNLLQEYANDKLILAPLFLTPIIAKNYISGLDFFAGARMHATIAAFSSGVPVFPMAYSRKFNGLFMDTLDYQYMGDLVSQTMDDILQGIKEAFDMRKELAETIQTRMNTIVKERETLLINKLAEALELSK